MEFIKYPPIPYLPFSKRIKHNANVLDSDTNFVGKRVVITSKMDGQGVSLYKDGFYTPETNREHYFWLSDYHARIARLIPHNMTICGEYMYAEKTIHYTDLPSYFLVYAVWEKDICLEWDDTCDVIAEFKDSKVPMYTVPVIYDGDYNRNIVEDALTVAESQNGEGFVVRLFNSFRYDKFDESIAQCTTSHVPLAQPLSTTKLNINELGWNK